MAGNLNDTNLDIRLVTIFNLSCAAARHFMLMHLMCLLLVLFHIYSASNCKSPKYTSEMLRISRCFLQRLSEFRAVFSVAHSVYGSTCLCRLSCHSNQMSANFRWHHTSPFASAARKWKSRKGAWMARVLPILFDNVALEKCKKKTSICKCLAF